MVKLGVHAHIAVDLSSSGSGDLCEKGGQEEQQQAAGEYPLLPDGNGKKEQVVQAGKKEHRHLLVNGLSPSEPSNEVKEFFLVSGGIGVVLPYDFSGSVHEEGVWDGVYA